MYCKIYIRFVYNITKKFITMKNDEYTYLMEKIFKKN